MTTRELTLKYTLTERSETHGRLNADGGHTKFPQDNKLMWIQVRKSLSLFAPSRTHFQLPPRDNSRLPQPSSYTVTLPIYIPYSTCFQALTKRQTHPNPWPSLIQRLRHVYSNSRPETKLNSSLPIVPSHGNTLPP